MHCYISVNIVRIINKQNKYPVLLLTQGENSGYEEYQDPRTWSINNGVLFAEMSGLLGLSVRAEAVLKNPDSPGHVGEDPVDRTRESCRKV